MVAMLSAPIDATAENSATSVSKYPSTTGDDDDDDEVHCMSYSTSEDDEFYDAEAPSASPQ